MNVNADLHIHSKYSAATSDMMDLDTIAAEARRKGIHIVGTGDALHPEWLENLRRLPERDGILWHNSTTGFVVTAEVEDLKGVHHLILIPDLSKAEELREIFRKSSSNMDTDGRPRVLLNGAEIADACIDADCIIGPSHAFTPWTGIFAHYRSLKECYGDRADDVSFIELGLSADSDYADRISELRDKTFLSNSDGHSPWSNKLGREFNQFDLMDISFKEIRLAIERRSGRRPILNVGFYPEEGKYNRTACTSCYKQYTMQEMDEHLGRCGCGGSIKLGVRDRVEILADLPHPVHPDHRPPYIHIIPLAEIIAMALGHRSVFTRGVRRIWSDLVSERTEIEVLLHAEISELNTDERVARAIEAFRSGDVVVTPGGGGRYGRISLPPPGARSKPSTPSQRSLLDF